MWRYMNFNHQIPPAWYRFLGHLRFVYEFVYVLNILWKTKRKTHFSFVFAKKVARFWDFLLSGNLQKPIGFYTFLKFREIRWLFFKAVEDQKWPPTCWVGTLLFWWLLHPQRFQNRTNDKGYSDPNHVTGLLDGWTDYNFWMSLPLLNDLQLLSFSSVTQVYTVWCYVMKMTVMLTHVMLYYVILCYVMLCVVVLLFC